MKSRRLVIAVVIAVFAYLLIPHQRSDADQAPPKDMYFSAPFVIATSASQSAYLADPELRMLGGRSFIVGKVVAGDPAWKLLAGNPMWIPTDSITNITEFKSLDALQAAVASASLNAEKKSQN